MLKLDADVLEVRLLEEMITVVGQYDGSFILLAPIIPSELDFFMQEWARLSEYPTARVLSMRETLEGSNMLRARGAWR